MRLETLTPLHIGSGEQLTVNLDFVEVDGNIFVLNKELFFYELSKIKGLSEEYFTKDRIDFKRFCGDNRLNYKNYLMNKISSSKVFSSFINELIKDGNNNPYIPGSSIKGSIRSDFIAYLFDDPANQEIRHNYFNKLKNKPERAGEKVIEELLSTAPSQDKVSNYNLMRAFQVSDTYFDTPEVSVYKTMVLNLSNENGSSADWKKNKRGKPMAIYYECFMPENSIEDSFISIDSDLFNENDRYAILNFKGSFNGIYEEQAYIINIYSERMIENELSFLKNIETGIKLDAIIKFYEDILKDIQDDTGAIYLRLAHGSGWDWMTRDLIKNVNNENEFNRVRSKYKLGKYLHDQRRNFAIFPKSRKFIVDKNNKPIYPMGWIKLSP